MGNSEGKPAMKSEKCYIGQWTKDWASEKKIPVWYQIEVDSTNSFAKGYRLPNEVGACQLFVVDHQRGGLGRNNSSWLDSELGSYLLCSWSFQTRGTPQPILAPRIGLALYRCLTKVWNQLDFALKAPNDIYIKDKKVAGVLIENVIIGAMNRLIIGIGLNVAAHPKDIPESGDLGGVTQAAWGKFLDLLWIELKGVTDRASEASLTKPVTQELVQALNKWVGLSEPIIEVSPQGDLIRKNSRISWHQL